MMIVFIGRTFCIKSRHGHKEKLHFPLPYSTGSLV